MYFGFALDLPDIDLWDIDFLDTNLVLLDTNSLDFCLSPGYLEDVFKT